MEKLCNIDGRQNLRINVGGTVFMCHADILKSFPESFLASIDKQMPNHKNNEYFFDRNPYIFAFILDGFRKGSIHVPKDICGTTFKEELEFWEVAESNVAPCCWEALYKSDEDKLTMQKLMKKFERNTNVFLTQRNGVSFKNRLWLFLDEPNSSKFALVWAVFISMLIVASTIIEAMESTPLLSVNYTESEKKTLKQVGEFLKWDNATYQKMATLKPHPYLKTSDIICHSIITMEFILGFIVCPNKFTYVSSFSRLFTGIGYISFWTTLTMERWLFESKTAVKIFTVLSFFTILKIARLFYLTKRTPAFGIIGLTLSSSKTELKILIFMLALLVCTFGFVIYSTEYQHSKITNVFIGMYWALITVTTVGYGDYVPVTPAGHVVAIACAVCGVIILALPIGIIASSFYTFYNCHKYCRRHFENIKNK
ncbi:potassium voltage-gated channel protein Shaw-like [Ruditapes philippinarum]|uniref:potassium voltage-gated channel protein Shaw-like n=1 Tax=Ruditapes philippinarum TaxID=129788 RepID=UPI00295BCE1E|nr:potassium voltage-gated channel protein Shaw-like [Ruditapes philippinarum]